MMRRKVQPTTLLSLAYVLALAFAGLAALVPMPEGSAGFELALPALAVTLMAATWRDFGIAFLVVTFSLSKIRLHIGSLEFPISDLAALGLLFGHCLQLCTVDPPSRRLVPLRVYVAFLAAAAISALVSAAPARGLYYALRIYTFYGVVYMFAVMPALRDTLRTSLRAILVPLVPMIMASIVFSIIRITVHADVWAEGNYDAGPFGHVQETLPGNLVLFWPFVRLLRQEADTEADRNALVTVEILLGIAVVIGFVKTAWLEAFAVFAAITIIEHSWRRGYGTLRRRLRILAVGAPLAIASFAALLTLINRGTFLHRAVQWVASIESWLQRPLFGHGPGTAAAFQFESVTGYVLRKGSAMAATEPHGIVIKLLPEVGLAGFLLYALCWITTFVLVARSFRTANQRTARFLTASFASLAGLITYLFATPDIFSARAWFVFALAVAIATARQDGDR